MQKAGIPGPYVLAGHSMGGLTVRLFAHEYTSDVAGVVLIDSMSPSEAKPSDGIDAQSASTSVTPRFVQTYLLDEGRGMPASLAQAGCVTSLGNVPLIVLSRGLDQRPEWMAQQAELLELSSHSQQLFATHSGHNIQLDEPAAAVGTIAHMVEQVRGHQDGLLGLPEP